MYTLKYFEFNGKHLIHDGKRRINSNTLDGALSQAETCINRIFPQFVEKWGAFGDTEVHETETHHHCKIKRYATIGNSIGRAELHWRNRKEDKFGT